MISVVFNVVLGVVFNELLSVPCAVVLHEVGVLVLFHLLLARLVFNVLLFLLFLLFLLLINELLCVAFCFLNRGLLIDPCQKVIDLPVKQLPELHLHILIEVMQLGKLSGKVAGFVPLINNDALGHALPEVDINEQKRDSIALDGLLWGTVHWAFFCGFADLFCDLGHLLSASMT